ncbi:MAG TPA: hypothetical protein VLL05_08550 [Terriglobales bacterium]|nr:hypothetical protein [Terriglobales bacterium]
MVKPRHEKAACHRIPSGTLRHRCSAYGEVHTVVVALLILTLAFPGRLGIAHAQEVGSAVDVDQRGAGLIADPCQDLLTPSALREALRLVCSRERVEAANHRIRKAIILGFVGGFVKRDDVKHPEVLFATHLRSRYGSAVHVAVFGNHEGKKAVEDIIQCLDSDKDGFLTAGEKEQVKIILYGHSWGASQTLTFARELQRRGIPVSLTIQIDSVKKFGHDDRTVPANVAKAVNFYQRKGLTHGQPLIVAADAGQTKILGNFHMKYEDHQVNCDNYRLFSRVFNKPHHQIENDPQVWDQIASFIDSELLRTDAGTQTASSSESSVLK